jgi:hypothetical protein
VVELGLFWERSERNFKKIEHNLTELMNGNYVMFGEPQQDLFAIVSVTVCCHNRVIH